MEYRSFQGLSASVMDIPVLGGSGFQLFDAATGAGLYSSRWAPQTVETVANGGRVVRFMALDGKFVGTHEVRRTGEGFDVGYRFTWRGDKPVRLENALGLVWSSCFADGFARFDGGTEWDLSTTMSGSREARRVGQPASTVELKGSAMGLRVWSEPKIPITLLDGRGAPEAWGQRRGAFWLGQESVRIEPNSTREFTVSWRIDVQGRARPSPLVAPAVRTALAVAAEAEDKPLPLVPPPKERAVREGWLPAGPALKAEPEAARALAERWSLAGQTGPGADVVAAEVPSGLPPGGFELRVGSDGVRIEFRDRAGLRHAYAALAQLAEVRDGVVGWRHQTVRDWPSVGWRGVHMFVGPNAREFHAALADRVLTPLRFDRVVLQCERTRWESLPGRTLPNGMAKSDLSALFDDWRGRGFEPIPLIQSLGHMEWFFHEPSRAGLALNPDTPYTLDLRKEGARQTIGALWDEAIEATGAKTVHFGLDEFGSRGKPDAPGVETRIWKAAVPFLDSVARKHGVAPMAWGDALLAPGEAGDAANAPNEAESSQRRAVVPSRWRIADWHYADEADPAYYRSLRLFRDRGHPVVAASWHRGANVDGHTLAAIAAGAGTLQTTWAGYVSEEAGIHREIDQFAAYVRAGSAAWSGKPWPAGLDAKAWFARAFWGGPAVPRPRGGSVLSSGVLERNVQVGLWRGVEAGGLMLHTPLTASGRGQPSPIRLECAATGSELAVFGDCAGWLGEGDVVARVTVTFADGGSVTGDIRYGSHVRARDDGRKCFAFGSKDGLGLYRLRFGGKREVRAVEFDSAGSMAGLRIRAVTLAE